MLNNLFFSKLRRIITANGFLGVFLKKIWLSQNHFVNLRNIKMICLKITGLINAEKNY